MKTEPIARARPVFAFVFILLCSLALSANPFMGSGSPQGGDPGSAGTPQSRAVSPVRTSPTNANLVAKQASLRDALGDYFYSWKQSGSRGLFWGIMGVSFLYGILHALGPGHRKTVIFSLYLTRGAPAWEPAGTGMLLSLLHGGAAVVLLLSMHGLSGAISGRADNITNWIEGSTYLVLIVVALILAAFAIKDLLAGSESKSGNAMSLGTILVTGLYPCPGAILVMVLSLSLKITGIGIFAVLAMSLGMSIPIIASGYLAWFGRTGLFSALKKNELMVARVSSAVALAGYTVLLVFSVYMAEPFIASLVRMIG